VGVSESRKTLSGYVPPLPTRRQSLVSPVNFFFDKVGSQRKWELERR